MNTPTPPNTTPPTWEEAYRDYLTGPMCDELYSAEHSFQAGWNARAALDRARIGELEELVALAHEILQPLYGNLLFIEMRNWLEGAKESMPSLSKEQGS